MNEEEREQQQAIVGEMDANQSAADLANLAAYSKPQFYRIAKRRLGEPPMTVRRRLLLERAAYRLTRSSQPITEIAFDASFESLEGFGRAFKAAFGLAPSRYRSLGPDEYRIDLKERLHFAPPLQSCRQGESNMNVPELMTRHHCAEMIRFIEACEKLPDDRLDRPMSTFEPYIWCDPTVTLRQMMGRASAFAAPWMDAINGEKVEYAPSTLEAMREAVPINQEGFLRILAAVDRDGSYDLTFVDAVCDPPEVFSYVGVLCHALTNAAYRRMVITQELRSLEIGIDKLQDPIDFARGS
ncbi:MAG: helix-turn-helix domain-containing protein [Fimbriimonas sp.]|nr:helix-turn-helix domain-containing protein [Fimbriimonas sp.]